MTELPFFIIVAAIIAALLVIPAIVMGVLDVCAQAAGLILVCFTFAGAFIDLVVGTTPPERRDHRHDRS
jgi:hypothetical protein